MTVATDPRKTGVAAGPTLLAASAVAASITGTLTETALATIAVPPGAMGLNGGLQVWTTWTVTNSANNKTLRVRLGGIAGAQYMANVLTTSTSFNDIRRIRNRNSASSQVGGPASGTFGAAGAAVVTSSLDTAAAQDISITAQLASAGETITLESYEVWLLP